MTNGDRLRELDNESLAGEIWRLATSELIKYINLPKWLDSEEKDYPIDGEAAIVRMDDGTEYRCRIVGKTEIFDQMYFVLVMEKDFPYSSRILKAPKKSVRKIEGGR